jgi:site-specific recombinase XerD
VIRWGRTDPRREAHHDATDLDAEDAVRRSRGCHTFRRCFATHLLEDGYEIQSVEELLGHKDVKTTMIYPHVLSRGEPGVTSPMHRL